MKTKLDGNTITLFPEGHVDSKNAAEFERDVMEALDAAPDAAVTFDIDKLEYMSSAVRRSSKTVKAINVSPDIYEIFDITGFAEMLDAHKR